MNKKIFLYLAIFGSISVQAQERWSYPSNTMNCVRYPTQDSANK